MALNPAYEAIGKGFVQQYYAMFDDPSQRPGLVNMYNVSFTGLLTIFFSVSLLLFVFFLTGRKFFYDL